MCQEHPESYKVELWNLRPPPQEGTPAWHSGSGPGRLSCGCLVWSVRGARPVFGFSWAGTSPSCLVMIHSPRKNVLRAHWDPISKAPARSTEHVRFHQQQPPPARPYLQTRFCPGPPRSPSGEFEHPTLLLHFPRHTRISYPPCCCVQSQGRGTSRTRGKTTQPCVSGFHL